MPFQDTNTVFGMPANSAFQVGASDVDTAAGSEQGILFPYPREPGFSWVYYECTVTCMLDSGIVVHQRLPQVDNAPDTLSSCDYADSRLGDLVGGVNLHSRDQYTDVVQRMAHSRYWFRLSGQAMRIGFQVPIPSLKTIGGVPAIPFDEKPQVAFNRVAPGGNYGGIILWHAYWSLWYTTAVPPRTNAIPAANPYARVKGDEPLPKGIQVPYTEPDDNAVKAAPPVNAARPAGGIVARPKE